MIVGLAAGIVAFGGDGAFGQDERPQPPPGGPDR